MLLQQDFIPLNHEPRSAQHTLQQKIIPEMTSSFTLKCQTLKVKMSKVMKVI